uniref:DNA-invertase Site-specific recombinase n=1 Tax=biofilter metagenome TaxID=1070537 RepID=A0A1A7GEY3_9ZZZZ
MQLEALQRAGCEVIYQEKQSAVKHRPQLEEVLSVLQRGDVLVVYKLDRLARSLKHLLNILERLAEVGAEIYSLTEAIDTTTPAGRMMVQVLGAVAEFERSLIRERSLAGLVSAYQRGVPLGRRRYATTPETIEAMRAMYLAGGISYAKVAKHFGVSTSTVKRLVTGNVHRTAMPVLSKLLRQ